MAAAAAPVVVITGASSGIGRATAHRFAKQGASIVLAARGAEALAEVVTECEFLGATAVAVPTDTSDAGAVQALADTALERFGRIDVWVNDAAVAAFAPLMEVPLEDVRRVLDVNVMGYVHGARSALPVMIRQGRGVLINVSSVIGEVAQPYNAAYSMSKSAVMALGVSLRAELRLAKHTGVHVSTVLPATIDTPFFQHAANYTGRRVQAMPPVYPADAVAKAIVRMARTPKDEFAVGPLATAMVRQHRRSPRPVEAQMALQVDTMHLSPTRTASPTAGTLFEPASASDDSVGGGWGGAPRTAGRNLSGAAAVIVGALLTLRAVRAPAAPPPRRVLRLLGLGA